MMGGLKNFLCIKIISKSPDVPTSYILSQVIDLYSRLYDCYSPVPEKEGSSEKCIIFNSPQTILNRFLKIMHLYDSYVRNVATVHKMSLEQKSIEARRDAKNIDFNLSERRAKFLIIKYHTDLKDVFKGYYHYLNHFFPLINVECYIEEVEDGFLLFFEKEDDFNLFLIDFRSKDSLFQLMQEKHIDLPEATRKKILSFITENAEK